MFAMISYQVAFHNFALFGKPVSFRPTIIAAADLNVHRAGWNNVYRVHVSPAIDDDALMRLPPGRGYEYDAGVWNRWSSENEVLNTLRVCNWKQEFLKAVRNSRSQTFGDEVPQCPDKATRGIRLFAWLCM